MFVFRCSNCHGNGKVPSATKKEMERRFFEISNDDLTPLVEKAAAWKEVKALYGEGGLWEECPVCLGAGKTRIGSTLKGLFVNLVLVGALVDAAIVLITAVTYWQRTGQVISLLIGGAVVVAMFYAAFIIEKGLSDYGKYKFTGAGENENCTSVR